MEKGELGLDSPDAARLSMIVGTPTQKPCTNDGKRMGEKHASRVPFAVVKYLRRHFSEVAMFRQEIVPICGLAIYCVPSEVNRADPEKREVGNAGGKTRPEQAMQHRFRR